MKIKIITLLFLTLALGCNKTIEKPAVTIQQYSKQVVVMNGVATKILNEQDPKKMFLMADSMESARAVDCIPVADECNTYYKLINKVVNITKDGSITPDQRMELFKSLNEFQTEVRSGELKVREIWKDYIKSQPNAIEQKSP